MMNEAMHMSAIHKSKVFSNTIQNGLMPILKEGLIKGYVGPAHFQPSKEKFSSATQPIQNQDVEASLLETAPTLPTITTHIESSSGQDPVFSTPEKAQYSSEGSKGLPSDLFTS
jgi:hypothetical protein